MNRITLIVATSAILLLFFTGCDKYHRNRYVGDWDFVTERTIYQRGLGEEEWKPIKIDTLYYSGKINLGNSEDELVIKFTENNEEIIVRIDTDGNLWISSPFAYLTYPKNPVGSFEKKDKIYLDFFRWWYDEDSIGINNVYHVEGTKKKGGEK